MCDVFFIDDEDDIRIAIEQSFELADISARLFDSTEEALLAVKSDGLPLVVVTDICLPGLTGQNLLNSIRHQDPDIPVILITGHGDISMAVQAMHDGAYDFIEKPFATERLMETVQRAIEKRQLTLENQQLKRTLKASQTLGPALSVLLIVLSHYARRLRTLLIPMQTFCCLAKQGLVRNWLHVPCMNKVHAASKILLPLIVVPYLKI